MLFFALSPKNSYGYYDLLRWVCFFVFGWVALAAKERKQIGWVCVLGIVVAVFNPFIPLHLDRELWSVIDLVAIGIAIASIFGVTMKESTEEPKVERTSLAEIQERSVPAVAIEPSVPVQIEKSVHTAIIRESRHVTQLEPPAQANAPELCLGEMALLMFALSSGWTIGIGVGLGVFAFALNGFKPIGDRVDTLFATSIPFGVFCAGVQIAMDKQKEISNLKRLLAGLSPKRSSSAP